MQPRTATHRVGARSRRSGIARRCARALRGAAKPPHRFALRRESGPRPAAIAPIIAVFLLFSLDECEKRVLG
jgi:hypothetical protein